MAIQTDVHTDLMSYVRDVSVRDDEILADARTFAEGLPGGQSLQVMAEEGQFLALLVALIGARNVLEIGTFTGYSALCMARTLPPEGRLVTCDINPKWIDIASGFWDRAGVTDRITACVGDAAATLEAIRRTDGRGSFDLIFVDADKARYVEYFESALELVRAGGLVVLDNTLFFGRVVDPSAQDADTCGIRELNARLHEDARVDISLLPIADGVTLARKR